jgi:hypothetical protein
MTASFTEQIKNDYSIIGMLSRESFPSPLEGEGGEMRISIEPDEGFTPHPTLSHGGEREDSFGVRRNDDEGPIIQGSRAN